MAFKPESTIYLCRVEFDSTYKNQVYFGNAVDQQQYFRDRAVRSYNDYLYVRRERPGGGTVSSIKVGTNIDLLATLNYLYYTNDPTTAPIFAFITKFIYINENTTEIVFETDVYQTWRFRTELKHSYVVREHSKTDAIGAHVVPEQFDCGEYVMSSLGHPAKLDKWGYLVASAERYGADGARGYLHCGIYQGLYFYYFTDGTGLNLFLDGIEEEGGDCIVFIAVIPQFCVQRYQPGDADTIPDANLILSTTSPASYDHVIDLSSKAFTFEGYTPKNKKLYSSPFMAMCVTNHAGDEGVYCIEDFSDRNNIVFRMKGDVCANPSITIYPLNYKGLSSNVDCGISISNFPQCAYNTDTYKLWLAKNQYGQRIDLVQGAISAGMGIAAGMATGGILGGAAAVQGMGAIANTFNRQYMASKEPNKSHSGSPKNNLLTAMGYNRFDFYMRTIKRNLAETIDDFFTMFGYQVNRLKVPNVSSRPYFNYVQTIDVNIVGDIPNEDMERLKKVYNDGVTLWKPHATIGDYSVDNSPN